MGYLDLSLEERCLRMRDLLLTWPSVPRITAGDVISVRIDDEISVLSLEEAKHIPIASYQGTDI
jgi:hypothetical protein